MNNYIYILLLLFSSLISFETKAQKKIIVVTGGHDFEQEEYYQMFDSFEGLVYDTITQPKANELITSGDIRKYDCIVFYDMFQDITQDQKEGYIELLNQGIGMVFTHHALVSYQNWPEFEKIIGGKYYLEPAPDHPASTYRHDVDFVIKIANKNHPITKGMSDFEIHDEVYGDYSVGKHVNPLLKTNHPESTSTIGWYHQYKNSRIVYLQPGHDHYAYQNINYRLLLLRSIEWASSAQ